MARLFKSSAAKRLELPGRVSLEPISGETGSRITVRVVEIPPAKPGDTPRGPHLHDGFEECIYVLRGTGAPFPKAAIFASDRAIWCSSRRTKSI